MAENHDGEDAASSEQHGDVAVEGVAEGQHDDVWFKLRKRFKSKYFLESHNLYLVDIVNQFLFVPVVRCDINNLINIF